MSIKSENLYETTSLMDLILCSLGRDHPLCQVCDGLSILTLASQSGVMFQAMSTQWDRRERRSSAPYDQENCVLCNAFRIAYEKQYKRDEEEHNEWDTSWLLRPSSWDSIRILLDLYPPRSPGTAHSKVPSQTNQIGMFRAWRADHHRLAGMRPREHAERHSYYLPPSGLSMLANTFDENMPFQNYFQWEDTSAERIEAIDLYPRCSVTDPLANFFAQKLVYPNLKSVEVIDDTKAWMNQCKDSHRACDKYQVHHYFPTRLIDIGDSHERPPRLVITSNDPYFKKQANVAYVALSYCWGPQTELSQQRWMTTSKTLASNIDALPLNQLPKTIKDAIEFTRSMGLHFLWADSICIVQGNDAMARADWAKESSNMASVYGGAELTIAAAWGDSMHSGIFKVRSVNSTEGLSAAATVGMRVASSPQILGKMELTDVRRNTVDSIDEPLFSRGWALQERILSPRVLICNRDQLVWECQTHLFSESGEQMNSLGHIRLEETFLATMADSEVNLESRIKTFHDMWQCIVTDYCHKALTEPSDRFPAIAGLAKQMKRFSPHSDNEYIAGMWSCALLSDILWAHEYLDDRRNAVRRVPRRKVPDRAPTWSWASVEGGVRWPYIQHEDLNPADGRMCFLAEVVDYKVTLRDASHEYGAIDGGAYMILKAPLWRLPNSFKWRLGNDHFHSSFYDIREAHRYIQHMYLDVDDEDSTPEAIFGTAQVAKTELFYLFVTRSLGLILSYNDPNNTATVEHETARLVEGSVTRRYYRTGVACVLPDTLDKLIGLSSQQVCIF